MSKKHRLSKEKRLTLEDLNGEHLVMPIEGASYEIDAFRAEVKTKYPTIQIVDSSYYGADTFSSSVVHTKAT